MEELLKLLKPGTDKVKVSQELYAKLLEEYVDYSIPTPHPSIKSRKEYQGFFTSSYEIEYNYDCPIYKKQVEDYLKSLDMSREKVNPLQILGPYGIVTIEVE